MSSWKELIDCKRVGEQPIFSTIFLRDPQLTISKAFIRSTNVMNSGFLWSLRVSCSWLSVKTMSAKNQLALNPDCLWQDLFGQPLQAFHKDSSKDLVRHRKERYSTRMITAALVSLIFVQGNDFGVLHFVRYFALSSALQQQCIQLLEKNIFMFLKSQQEYNLCLVLSCLTVHLLPEEAFHPVLHIL